MKTQTLGLLSAVGALAIASAGSLISCSQPPIECTAAHGDFVVRYIPVSGDMGCNSRFPDFVGFQTYNPTTNGIAFGSPANRDKCTAVGDDFVCEGTEADTEKVFIGLQSDEIGTLLGAFSPDSDTSHKAFSFGQTSSNIPANGICTIPMMSVGEQNVASVNDPDPDGAGGAPPGAEDPTHVMHQWSNVKILVTASAPGTAFEADFTVTVDSCSATFKAIGVYPPVQCGEFGDIDGDPMTPDEWSIDETLCNPKPDLSKGRAFGSGLNPDFPIKCEQSDTYGAAFCVLATDSIASLVK